MISGWQCDRPLILKFLLYGGRSPTVRPIENGGDWAGLLTKLVET